MDGGAWKAAVHGVAEDRTRLSDFTYTFHFHAVEKEMATHSSVLAWRNPRMGEPGELPSMGSHRVRHDWSDLAAAYMINMYKTCINIHYVYMNLWELCNTNEYIYVQYFFSIFFQVFSCLKAYLHVRSPTVMKELCCTEREKEHEGWSKHEHFGPASTAELPIEQCWVNDPSQRHREQTTAQGSIVWISDSWILTKWNGYFF